MFISKLMHFFFDINYQYKYEKNQFYRANALLKDGKFEKAENIFRELLEKNPSLKAAEGGLIEVYRQKSKSIKNKGLFDDNTSDTKISSLMSNN